MTDRRLSRWLMIAAVTLSLTMADGTVDAAPQPDAPPTTLETASPAESGWTVTTYGDGALD